MKKIFLAWICGICVSCTTNTDIYMKDSTIKTDTAVSQTPSYYVGPPTYFPTWGPVWGPAWGGGGWGGSPSVFVGGGGGWGGGCW